MESRGRYSTSSKLPFVVERSGSSDPEPSDLSADAWFACRRDWIDRRLEGVGAILFRGFGLRSPEEFQRCAAVLGTSFMDYTRGATPRTQVQDDIYTSTDAPRFVPIPLHCELSYSNRFPARILFCCLQPARSGGQTPVADMQEVYRRLDPEVRDAFEDKGLRLIQNVPSRRTLTSPKSWRSMFGTDEREKVESACRTLDLDYAWAPNGALSLFNVQQPSIDHPVTGARIWFNSAHNFHDSWSWEFEHQGSHGVAVLLRLLERRRQRVLAPDQYPNFCTFGDGTPIPRRMIDRLRAVLWEHAEVFDWRAGDFLLLDNLRVAHARLPYRGARKVVVAQMDPMARSSDRSVVAARGADVA